MILNLNDRTAFPLRTDSLPAQVWTKPTWSAPFTLRPDLIPTQTTWTTAPEVATAALEYRYGRIVLPGAALPVDLAKITARGYWVLIRWLADDGGTIDWLGYAETPVTRDHSPARNGLPATGKQTIRCTGLLRALQQCYVDSTVYVNPQTPAQAARSGGTGWTFNQGMRGNRSQTKMQIGASGPSAYVFALPRATDAQWWSTRDIVEHLVRFHLPTPTGLAIGSGVPWSAINLDLLPDWDRPVIDSDTRDVASILADLLQPSRLLAYTIGAVVAGSAPPTVTSVTIAPFTTIAAPLVITAGTLPANPSQIAITAAADPLTTITADADASGVVDQVIVQGPREISVAAFNAQGGDSAWQEGWTGGQETEYIIGGANAPDWSTLPLTEKRIRNDAIRSRNIGGKLRDVFSLFTLRPNFNWTFNNKRIFWAEKASDPFYRPSPLAVEFLLEELPLFANIDYSGDPAQVDESGGVDAMPPLWFYALPGQPLSFYRMFREQPTARHDRELPFRSWTLVPKFEEGPALRLVTENAPQHAIAGGGFVGNDADVDQMTVYGDNPTDAWRVVIGVRGDRRPRFAIPAPADVAGLDVVRRKLITIDDDSLQLVYIAEGTELGFNEDGEVITSSGGLLRDPFPVLRSLCQLLHAQHGQPRYTATITTGRRLSSMSVGMLLTSVDTEPVPINAPITRLKIDAPLAEDSAKTSKTTQTISAQNFPGDVLSLLRSQQPRRRRPRR